VFLKKFLNVGFEAIVAGERRPFALSDIARYPLFSPDFLEFLQAAVPPERHAELVWSIVVTATKPMP
jgi:hypothetical protein